MAKKILVVVDAQNDFITGVLGNRSVTWATNVIADEIRSGKYDNVIFTRDTHDENYLNTQEGRKLRVTHCIKGTNGWEVDGRLKDAMKERGVDCDDMTYIDKPTFGCKELGELLAGYDNSDTEIYFCGFCTGICVISIVAIAKTFCKEAEVSVIENACACVTPESHKTGNRSNEDDSGQYYIESHLLKMFLTY